MTSRIFRLSSYFLGGRPRLLSGGGVDWVTALRSPAIHALVEARAIQMDLFDERGLFELTHPDYPGERLVACRNPQLEKRRKAKLTHPPVAAARRSASARRKAQTRHLEDGRNAHSFQTLLTELVQLTRNSCGVPGDSTVQGEAQTFVLETHSNPTQRQALKLLETIQARSLAPV